MIWQRGPLWLAAIALAVIAVAVLVGATNRGFAASANPVVVSSGQPTGIVVSGEGKVSVVPDVAVVNLGVEARAATVEAARDQAAQAMDAVMSSLGSNGVDKKDIKTQSLNITPEWRHKSPGEPPHIVGYIVTNQVTVKIRNLGQVTGTIDSAIAAGGDAMRMHGIQFTVDDPAAAMNQARAQAMADAKAKAEQLARLSSVSVGQPIHISDQVISASPGVARLEFAHDAAASTAQTPIEPGESEIRVVVQATYAIQ